MDENSFSHYLMYFIALEMTDHMPTDILWQDWLFLNDLLNFIFTEIPCPGFICLFQHRYWFGLAYRNKSNLFWITSCPLAGIFYIFSYFTDLLFYHDLFLLVFIVYFRNLFMLGFVRRFYYESPGRQPRMSHACMSEFTGIGRASRYEQGAR